MVYRCVSKCADFQSDQILSHHGDVHTIAMALIPTRSSKVFVHTRGSQQQRHTHATQTAESGGSGNSP